MSLGKKDIIKNISSKAHISTPDSKNFFNTFIHLLKNESKTKEMKIAKFGNFYYQTTPQRFGRNPKTKEAFVITQRTKLVFRPSGLIKTTLN